MIKQEKYTAKRQFELIAGDKVLFAHDLDFVTLEYLGMTGANGSWMFAKEEIKTFGTENPRERVNGIDNDTQVIVKNYVKQMFPELQ